MNRKKITETLYNSNLIVVLPVVGLLACVALAMLRSLHFPLDFSLIELGDYHKNLKLFQDMVQGEYTHKNNDFKWFYMNPGLSYLLYLLNVLSEPFVSMKVDVQFNAALFLFTRGLWAFSFYYTLRTIRKQNASNVKTFFACLVYAVYFLFLFVIYQFPSINSLYSENFYIPLVLIVVAYLSRLKPSKRSWLGLAVLILLTQMARPFAVVGILCAILAYFLLHVCKIGFFKRNINWINICILMVVVLGSLMLVGKHIQSVVPFRTENSKALHMTFRVLSADGIFKKENGHYSKILRDTEEKVAKLPEYNSNGTPLADGIFRLNKEVARFLFRKDYVGESSSRVTAKIIWMAAVESIYAEPLPFVFYTAVHSASMFAGFDFYYFSKNRYLASSFLVPPQWSNVPRFIFDFIVGVRLFPILTFLLIIVISIRQKSISLLNFVGIWFLLTHIFVTALFEPYLSRYFMPVGFVGLLLFCLNFSFVEWPFKNKLKS